jgi:hypothetical protein
MEYTEVTEVPLDLNRLGLDLYNPLKFPNSSCVYTDDERCDYEFCSFKAKYLIKPKTSIFLISSISKPKSIWQEKLHSIRNTKNGPVVLKRQKITQKPLSSTLLCLWLINFSECFLPCSIIFCPHGLNLTKYSFRYW